MEQNQGFMESEHIGRLMRRYAIPCTISLLVAALYNIVDQLFIANTPELGSYGNAANTVVFPLTVVALAIAVMIGDGCCSFVSMALGGRRIDDAAKSVGNAITASAVSGVLLMAAYLLLSDALAYFYRGNTSQVGYYMVRLSNFLVFVCNFSVSFFFFNSLRTVKRSSGLWRSYRFHMAL